MTKKLQIAGLAALIVLTWGYVMYSWINPPKAYLGHEDKVAMAMLLDTACPFLKDRYEALEVDGEIELDGALAIYKKCEQRIQVSQFYRVLVEEFSKQEHRQ